MKDKSKSYILNIGEGISKSGFSAVPFVGGLLNEIFFDLRSRLKQERLNHFIEELIKYMSSISEDEINYEYIRSEQFSDLFETILKRVIVCSSKEKLKRLKIALVTQITDKDEPDHVETFLDIIMKINETQIRILKYYQDRNTKKEESMKIPERGVVDGNFTYTSKIAERANYFSLSEVDYLFYIQDLAAKGLLIDDSINRLGIRPYEIVKISSFGLKFLSFIKEYNGI